MHSYCYYYWLIYKPQLIKMNIRRAQNHTDRKNDKYLGYLFIDGVMGWIVSLQIPGEALTHRTSECDCIWKQCLYSGDLVKARLWGWAPIRFDWCLYKKRKFIGSGTTGTHLHGVTARWEPWEGHYEEEAFAQSKYDRTGDQTSYRPR